MQPGYGATYETPAVDAEGLGRAGESHPGREAAREEEDEEGRLIGAPVSGLPGLDLW